MSAFASDLPSPEAGWFAAGEGIARKRLTRPTAGAGTYTVESRRFVRRAVRHIARAGVRQFLVVGAGTVTSPATHLVAHQVDPGARVVYVDGNRLVLALARTLNSGGIDGTVGYALADIRKPDELLATPQVQVLDFTDPVALLLVGVLHHLTDEEEPYVRVERLVRDLAPGSYLAISHLTHDGPARALDVALRLYRRSGVPVQPRSRADVTRFFTGFDLVEPGIELVSRWRPWRDEGLELAGFAHVPCLGGLGRLP